MYYILAKQIGVEQGLNNGVAVTKRRTLDWKEEANEGKKGGGGLQ